MKAIQFIQLKEKEIEALQQFTSKTPISVLLTCLKPSYPLSSTSYSINSQSYPLLNLSILSLITQQHHQQLFLYNTLLYEKICQKEGNEILFLFVFHSFHYWSLVLTIPSIWVYWRRSYSLSENGFV